MADHVYTRQVQPPLIGMQFTDALVDGSYVGRYVSLSYKIMIDEIGGDDDPAINWQHQPTHPWR